LQYLHYIPLVYVRIPLIYSNMLSYMWKLSLNLLFHTFLSCHYIVFQKCHGTSLSKCRALALFVRREVPLLSYFVFNEFKIRRLREKTLYLQRPKRVIIIFLIFAMTCLLEFKNQAYSTNPIHLID
jgi:hypothetical protein